MDIGKKIYSEIYDVLIGHMGDKDSRKALIESALIGCAVLDDIDWEGGARTFTGRLLRQLNNFGDYRDNKPAVIDLLEVIGESVGATKQREIEVLIAKIGADHTPDPDVSPLPAPPELYASPKYTLTEKFVGRTNELGKLDAWAQSDDPMMIVEAIGGMGKSAVTWEWVDTRARDVLKPDGILWWSFYERGATMRAFVRHALAYLTKQHPDALKNNDLRENLTQLTRALDGGRYLLVLDGLERILVMYHRWSAVEQRDDTIEDAETTVTQRDIRACTDPKDDDVLKALWGCKQTKTLVSSRLLPIALENRMGQLNDGIQHIHLNGLHPDDALALVRHGGVTVDDERQFKAFTGRFGNHSLLVTLVAGQVLKFRRARGSFDRWYKAVGHALRLDDLDPKQSKTHILEYAFDGLDAPAMTLLSQLAAFDDNLTYDTMGIFNPFVTRQAPEKPVYEWWQSQDEEKDKQYEQEQADYDRYLRSIEYKKALAQFDDLLTELEERGLLRWEPRTDTYDMHPVVRGYAFDRLEGDERVRTYERVQSHFERQTPDDLEAAQEVADLANTIAIYRALVGAGKLDAAAQFYLNRLGARLGQNIAAYYTVIELLTPLFPDGTDTVPRLTKPSDQSDIVTHLAAMFQYTGRTATALTLKGLKLKINMDADDLPNLIIGLQNYGASLRSDNQLALAERAYDAAKRLAVATEDDAMVTRSTLYLLASYADTGRWEQADEAYATLTAHPPRDVFWQADVEKYHAQTLIVRGGDAGAALAKAESLAVKGNDALGIRQIKWLWGEVALRAGDARGAVALFEEALALARQHGSADVATYLACLANAQAHLDPAKSRAYAEEALHQTNKEEIHDMYASLAEAYLTLGETEHAREHALRAYRWAWADGAPYVWWWELERAKAVLDAVGEPHPVLPPYDPSKVGKFPYEDEIEAIIERERAKRESSS